jgi:acetylornithine deacetylase/succinyl-diaminopimelate desuccinylase-like protein
MIIAFLSTLEGLIATDGSLPVNVKFIWDGAEEFGSQGMPAWLTENSDWIAGADFGVNVDAMMAADDQGLMWRGLRGGSDVEVRLTSANTALHSGIYGGAAPNAAVAASKIIASMWNADGTVAIEGFADDVIAATEMQRAEIAAAVEGVDEAQARKRLDIAEWVGDEDYTIIERTWIRPSLDVTGVKSGYLDGKASIIPFDAWFRVMSRTAPGQDPVKVNEAIMAHIKKHTPWGVRVEMNASSFGGAPFFDDTDLGFQIGKQVLTDYFNIPPQVLYVGGGVPALAYVPDAGGPQLITFGFQRSDEGFHADNEFMRLSSFRSAQRAYAMLLHAFRDQPKRNQ